MKYPKLLIIFFFIFCHTSQLMAENKNKHDNLESSFKACKDKNIYLTSNGNHIGICRQGSSNSFSGLAEILGIGNVLSFQKKIKDMVHTKIELKIFETEMLEACAENNTSWFLEKSIRRDDIKSICGEQIEQIKNSIKERFPLVRKHLALSSTSVTEGMLLKNKASDWYNRKITHGYLSDFASLDPLADTEVNQARHNFISELSDKMLEEDEKNKESIMLTSQGVRVKNIRDVMADGKKNTPKKSNHDILVEFLSDPKKPYAFKNDSKIEEDIQKIHKDEYFKIMNQMPLIGYIGDIKIGDPNSPNSAQLANALKKSKEKLKKYLLKLKENDHNGKKTKWVEYAQFTPEIEKILEKNPNFCGTAETLLKVKSKEENIELYTDLALAATASVPCFFAGPVAGAVCISAGLGIGAKGVSSALSAEENNESRNLTDFLGEDGYADFQALNEKERNLAIQTILLPLGSFGKMGTQGKIYAKVIKKSYHAYDDMGVFLAKGEGLELANQAMAKLASSKNFKELTAAERAKQFDKILAEQVLPKEHFLASFENKSGGFKLIDTNYDFDNFPPALLETLADKLGSKEEAIKFVKETYHRHVLDHHGTLGNMQNATQQVLSIYSSKALELAKLSNSNPIRKKIAEEIALRNLKKEFFRVSTDNLGDGQLATFLIKNHSKEMLTDPKFVRFMNRVANIEDFESFGPGIYKKFAEYEAKISKGLKLNSDELYELNAINTAMARQKAINDTLLKYGTNETLGDARKALLFADRFNGFPPDIQKKMVEEVDTLTKKILADNQFRDSMAKEYVGNLAKLAGSIEQPGLVREAEVIAKNSYDNISPKTLQIAKEEIFAFNASKLRSEFEKISGGKPLGPFDVFHAPQSILGDKKKVLVSISNLGEKRSFVVAFGNGLRKDNDSLKIIAKEIHLVEKRTLEKLIRETTDLEKIKIYQKELDAVGGALNNPNIEKFGGPASMMRSAADDANVKDLVFNFNGIRSSESDIMEAVVKARAGHADELLSRENKIMREELFKKSK